MFGHVNAHVCWFSCVFDLNLTSFDAQNSTIPCPRFVRSWVADCSNTSALPVQHGQPFGARGFQIPNKWGVSWSYTHWVSQPDSPHWVNGSKIMKLPSSSERYDKWVCVAGKLSYFHLFSMARIKSQLAQPRPSPPSLEIDWSRLGPTGHSPFPWRNGPWWA